MSAKRGSMATAGGLHHRERASRVGERSYIDAPTSIGSDQQRNQKDQFFTPRSPAPHRAAYQRSDQHQTQQHDHAFFTARRSTDDAHRSSFGAPKVSRVDLAMDRGAGNESDVMETARDTARSSAGFDTDDYMSTFEPDTSRTSRSGLQVRSECFTALRLHIDVEVWSARQNGRDLHLSAILSCCPPISRQMSAHVHLF